MPNAVHLTFDIDWAPEFVLEDLLSLIETTDVPITWFTTHQSDGVKKLHQLPRSEVALHPNFLSSADESEVLSQLINQFPAAKGIRNHVLYYHSRLLPLFHQCGLKYFSNDLLFLHHGIAPYFDWSGMIRLPIFWEDDVHCTYFDRQFQLADLALNRPGLKIFNFHPIHIYLNTQQLSDYQHCKADLLDHRTAHKHRHGGPGIRTMFETLITNIDRTEAKTLGEVADHFSLNNIFQGRNILSYE